MNILEVKNIDKSYGKVKVVDNISFEVKRGEIMGILGPNGAGKTTTIRMIMGITAPDAGELRFNLNGEVKEVKQNKVGYLPEERGLYREAKVLDILVVGTFVIFSAFNVETAEVSEVRFCVPYPTTTTSSNALVSSNKVIFKIT